MKLVHGSLFSGFDAPSVAASWMGWKNAFHCEINPFCNEILKYWFPNSEHYEDITKTDFSQWKGRIDVLTGGFPCQPFSLAGQRKGADDNRYLWPHMLRAIREIRPAWVIGENVAGILTMVQPGKETEVGSQTSLFGEDNRKRILLRQEYVVETICKDLEREGYSVQPLLIPACAVGAPHRRDRVWFIAHCADSRTEDVRREREDKVLSDGIAPDTNGKRCNNRSDNWKERPFYYDWKRYSEEGQSEWNKRKCGTCKNSSTTSDSQCSGSGQIHEKVQPEEPNGDSTDRNGYEWDATNSNSEKLQEWLKTGRRSNEAENRARMDNGIERFGSLRYAPYSYNKRLQGCINFGSVGKEKKKSSHEQFSGSLFPDWQNFPTQSPVCRGNDGLPMPNNIVAFFEERNRMDRDYIIYNSLKSGKLHANYETGEIYSTSIRGHEGKHVALKGSICNGYIVHTISFNGIKKQCRAHQIVWISANGLYDKEKYQIDHINRDRKDNRISNLRLVTRKENIANQKRTDTNILSIEDRLKVCELFYIGHMKMRDIAEDFGVSKSTIFNIVHKFDVDDLTIPFTKWRQESVKGYGNAIVPQVILEIFKAIEEIEQLE